MRTTRILDDHHCHLAAPPPSPPRSLDHQPLDFQPPILRILARRGWMVKVIRNGRTEWLDQRTIPQFSGTYDKD